MKWLSTRPTSYWQQGCDDGKAGKPRREPGTPGIADMANVSYMNGWHFGRSLREAAPGYGVNANDTPPRHDKVPPADGVLGTHESKEKNHG